MRCCFEKLCEVMGSSGCGSGGKWWEVVMIVTVVAGKWRWSTCGVRRDTDEAALSEGVGFGSGRHDCWDLELQRIVQRRIGSEGF